MIRVNHPATVQEPASINPVMALVFHSDGKSTFATKHSVGKNNSLLRGSLVDPDKSKQLVSDILDKTPLINRKELEITPEHVLIDNSDVLMWFKASTFAPMWFSDGGKAKSYHVNYPNLIFMIKKKSRSLYVCSVSTKSRPSLDTVVYQAPIYNTGRNGIFCLGSANLPRDININTIERCEACVLDSQFTHPNTDNLIKGVKGNKGYMKFIRAMSKNKTKLRARNFVKMQNVHTLKDWLGSL